MKAIVYTKYGSPDELQLTDVEKPRPKNDEVLVQDSTYMLYHLGSDGKVIWNKMLSDPIIGKKTFHLVHF